MFKGVTREAFGEILLDSDVENFPMRQVLRRPDTKYTHNDRNGV